MRLLIGFMLRFVVWAIFAALLLFATLKVMFDWLDQR